MTQRKKLLIFKVLIFIFAFFIAFMPSTAMRNKEVNSRVIVEILGLDKEDGKVSITAQYVMPTEQQQGTGKDTVTVDGDSLTEAVEQLNTALGRRAELGHASMVIVGKSVTPDILGTLMTATDVTADVWLSAAEDKAGDTVVKITDFMKKTGATDANFIAYSAKKSHIATNTLLGFLSDLGSASGSAYLPIVKMEKPDSGENSQSGSGGEGGQSGKQEGQGESGEKEKKAEKSGMSVDTLALYSHNERVGELDKCASRGIAWVSAPIENGIVVTDVTYNGKTVEDVSGRLLKKHASVNIDKKRGSATLKIKAYIEPNGDRFNALGATNDPGAERAIRAGFAACIKDEIMCAVEKLYEVGCDAVNVGREFYRYAPDYYETQYNFASTEISVDVDVVLK